MLILRLHPGNTLDGTHSRHETASPDMAEKSFYIAVGNDISQKYSCGTLILSVSAGEWTNRGKEIMKDQCVIKNKL